MLEISLIVIQWIFFAYTSYRIGNKLHIKKSYPWYLIPLWNFWILAKKSEIKIKYFFWILIIILIIILIGLLLIWEFDIRDASAISIIAGADGPTSIFIANRLAPDFIGMMIGIVKIVVIAIFWGSVARKMGKEYGVYVVLGLLSIYLPPLILAFESIEKVITANRLSNVCSPLVGEEKEAWDKENCTPKEKKIHRVVSVGVLLLIFSSIVYTVS